MAAWLRPFQLTALVRRHDPTRMLALFGLINGGASVGLVAILAHATRSPFLFPSLGPTAFLLFYEPTAAASSPRNALLGHLVGAVAGWLSLAAFGLLDAAPALRAGVSWAYAGAAALSLGSTSAIMILLRAPHPPAGATTLIVSLGLMPHLWQIPVLLAAVFLLLVQAFVINRLAGLPYPLWTAPESPEST
ncbi:HPP family protein [Alienimonas californiensis]|uniref:HPP family protein n=1 Tax=Alienimonas californiensis TaxID=2527989 RepID=A0A517P817_9PLAN|nr:HPP family protein [Alienimonas californiensis]QDT15518.1 HPP family protein [Alienimonas californiensis]